MWYHGLTHRTRFEEVRSLLNKIGMRTQLKASKMAQWKERKRKGRERTEDSLHCQPPERAFEFRVPTPGEAVSKEEVGLWIGECICSCVFVNPHVKS